MVLLLRRGLAVGLDSGQQMKRSRQKCSLHLEEERRLEAFQEGLLRVALCDRLCTLILQYLLHSSYVAPSGCVDGSLQLCQGY